MKTCKVVIVTKQYGHIPYGSILTIIERKQQQYETICGKRAIKYFVDSFIYDGQLFSDWYHNDECPSYWYTNNDCPCFSVLCE